MAASRLSFFLAVVLVAVQLAAVPCLGETDCTPSHLNDGSRWYFRGGGFHMSLVLEGRSFMETVTANITVESNFFFDVEEVRNHFTVEAVSEAGVATDVTGNYALVTLDATEHFDIEAPVFKVPYEEATVFMKFQKAAGDEGAAGALSPTTHVRFVIPVHTRYPFAFAPPEGVDRSNLLVTQGPAAVLDALLHADRRAFIKACVQQLRVQWASEDCGAGYEAKSTEEELCTVVPAGELNQLPTVYALLIGLLWFGAMIVFSCMCIPPLW